MNKLLVETNYFDILEKSAKYKKISRDNTYKDYIKYIIEYCKNKKIILYINEKDYTLHIYTNNIFSIGKNLCDELFKKFTDPYFKLSIIHPKLLCIINWKYFSLCKMYDLGIINFNRNIIKINEVINTVIKDEIKYFSDNELLIKFLDIITDLEMYDEWNDELYNIDNLLKKLYDKEIFDLPKIEEIHGGSKYETQIVTSDFIKSKIITNFLPNNNDFVLTGSWVYNLLAKYEKKNKLYTLEELDLITKINRSDEAVEKIYNFIKKYTEQFKIINKIIRIPFDEFTEKYTIYVIINDKKIPIINIYNTASYKLIPYIVTSDNIKITSLLYTLKILCINNYWQTIHYNCKIIDEEKYKIKKNIYDNIIVYLLNNKELKSNLFKEKYYGIFIEKSILLKEKHINEMYYPYFPFLSKK